MRRIQSFLALACVIIFGCGDGSKPTGPEDGSGPLLQTENTPAGNQQGQKATDFTLTTLDV